jgi:hypothetical protein
MHHDQEEGDSLVFELAEHGRFKVLKHCLFTSTLHNTLD